MKKHILTALIFLFTFGVSQVIYKVPIHDTIDLGLPPFIERSIEMAAADSAEAIICLLYTSPSPRDKRQSRMPSSA